MIGVIKCECLECNGIAYLTKSNSMYAFCPMCGKEARQMPRESEPNELLWKVHGLDCHLLRGPLGAWCGYVGVLEGHPDYGVDYGTLDYEVHGGLTYGQMGDGLRDETLWWLGFDCAHYNDFVPLLGRPFEGTYHTIEYAKKETENLARQIAANRKKPLPAGTE